MTFDFMTFSNLPQSILRPLNIDEIAAIVEGDRKVVLQMIKEGGLPKSVLSRSKKAAIGSQPLLKPIARPIGHFELAGGYLLSRRLRR
ncbi:hypothetical protein [uncultured Sulfitobacter sp.]|uniref:hypothetical protein n=1 Tax=uncultured Sulfitobacter sp. TaxID=191468 RepID=UPI000C46FB62|nr:hypothetical protein [Sulfitobacter sp.]|tara:strand:- start:2500 stop:2763 length:264 start_codon:yes stop_codon:yes gene_type:complete